MTSKWKARPKTSKYVS